MHVFREENSKPLLKDIKELNKWREGSCPWIRRLNIAKLFSELVHTDPRSRELWGKGLSRELLKKPRNWPQLRVGFHLFFKVTIFRWFLRCFLFKVPDVFLTQSFVSPWSVSFVLCWAFVHVQPIYSLQIVQAKQTGLVQDCSSWGQWGPRARRKGRKRFIHQVY